MGAGEAVIAALAVAAAASLAPGSRRGSSGGAPGYRSWSWIQQDWRSVVVEDDGSLDWSKKCGAEGTQTSDGRPALCLPRWVIEQLRGSKQGREILRQQATRKWGARKGERVPWHPRIRELHQQLEARTPEDR